MITIGEGSGQGSTHDLLVRAIATVQERPLVLGDALVLVDPVTGHQGERHGGTLRQRYSKSATYSRARTERQERTDFGRRTMVPAAPSLVTWSHPFDLS